MSRRFTTRSRRISKGFLRVQVPRYEGIGSQNVLIVAAGTLYHEIWLFKPSGLDVGAKKREIPRHRNVFVCSRLPGQELDRLTTSLSTPPSMRVALAGINAFSAWQAERVPIMIKELRPEIQNRGGSAAFPSSGLEALRLRQVR